MSLQNGEGAPNCGDSRDAQEFVGWRARHISNKSERSQTQVVRAELTGSNTCTAIGITAQGHAPALALCRQLLAQGLDPDRALEIYRGAVLAFRIKSIGAGAEIAVEDDRYGVPQFRRSRGRGAGMAPPVRKNGRAAQ